MYYNSNHLTLSEQNNENFQSTEKISLHTYFRSSHGRCSVRKGILRNFTKFTGKHLCQRPATLLKKDSGTDVFQWILQNF